MRVVEYKNVFLTRSGIALKRFRLISESIHHYPGKRSHFWFYALFQYFFRRTIYLKGKYFVAHNHWCPGYFHWITEALPRLLLVRNSVSNRTLVLPEAFKEKLYPSIAPLFEGPIFWIPQEKNLMVENLLLPENAPFSGEYNKNVFIELRNIYLIKSIEKQIKLHGNRKIYLSRAKAARRSVVNENELIDFLKKNEFAVLHFEDYSFWEQVSLMQDVEIFISIHGAGLSNALFMKEGGTVIELQKRSTSDPIDTLYKDFSEMLKLNYQVLFCSSNNSKEPIYTADIIVNLNELESLLLKSKTWD